MNLLRAWLAGLPAYLWSGWGAIASLFLLLAVEYLVLEPIKREVERWRGQGA